LSSAKGCEVCGGLVRQARDEGSLGYCTKCGIVYFLGKVSSEGMEPTIQDLGKKFSRERGTVHQTDEPPSMEPAIEAKTDSGHWICPDCGTRFEYAHESDLAYVKREHFREFHPNRMND
jgi:hypothetical protein